MSGARIALHLALELKRRGGGVGAAALCGGGGQGDALIVRRSQELIPRAAGVCPRQRRLDSLTELVEPARRGRARGRSPG